MRIDRTTQGELGMKKCHDCGETKGLKSAWFDDDEGIVNGSCCKRCFFDNEYENESEVTKDNWDDYDYKWEKKKQ